jgi:small-conductance mechanosensitive channel
MNYVWLETFLKGAQSATNTNTNTNSHNNNNNNNNMEEETTTCTNDEFGNQVCMTPETTILRGKVSELIQKLLLTPHEWISLMHVVAMEMMDHWEDLLLISMLTILPISLARFMARQRYQEAFDHDKFDKGAWHRRAKMVSEIGKVYGLIYLVDLASFVCDTLQLDYDTSRFGMWAAGLIALAWGARFLSFLKTCYIVSYTKNNTDITQVNTAHVASKGLDILIYGATFLAMLDSLSIETGFAIKSIFGLSSFGTLVFSLASRDLMAEFLASLAIQVTNMYKRGDQIWLADGTQGIVQKAGWLNTLVRMGDEKVVRIPNTKIAGSRMANLSRTTQSQVTQKVCFAYSEWSKLPKLSQDIKEEIRTNIPTVITDGSRAFRAQWREVNKASLTFVVDTHYEQAPACGAYWEMREEVLRCIMRACEKNHMRFAMAGISSATLSLGEED